jgi:hypothetical protein
MNKIFFRVFGVLIVFCFASFFFSFPSLASGLKRNPPGLGMSVQELFTRWMDACGGESYWKGIIDIDFNLTRTSSVMGIVGEVLDRKVYIKMQPQLRIKSIFTTTGAKKKTIYGFDRKGWFRYEEDVPVGKGRWEDRRPDVDDYYKTRDEVSYELKGIGFWLGIPFILQSPGVKLRFAGFLKPGKIDPHSEQVKRPLPMLEVDLAGLGDWPIDLVTVALHPDTWLPVEARYRFTDQDGAWHVCLFEDYKKINNITYPAKRIFFKDEENWEIEEVMSNVRVNSFIHDSHFQRPGPMEQWR